MGWFALLFVEPLSRGACETGLHSAVFHFHLASEPLVLPPKTLQRICCEHVAGLNPHFCGVQMLLFSGASERRGILGESLQVEVIQ